MVGVAGFLFLSILAWNEWVGERAVSNRLSPMAYLDHMETAGVPDLLLTRMDGTQIPLSSFRGRLVLLNFWASWCDPCVREYPSMVRLIRRFKGRLVLVAVSNDDSKVEILEFLKTFGGQHQDVEIFWDQDKSIKAHFQVERIPETFVLGRDLKLIRKIVGIERWDSEDAFHYFESLM